MPRESSAFGCMENPFLIGNDNAIFTPHDGLGFVISDGDFIGRKEFLKRQVVIDELKQYFGRTPIILNMGDSSTSGWHSDSLSRTGINKLTDPYFHYKTYSDLMREVFPGVINAGVSKYASLQGSKRLASLLRDFSKNDIHPDYVTLYFGNNDGVFSPLEDKTAIDGMPSTEEDTSQRVLPADFKYNLLEMVRLSRCYGAKPIIIIPLRRYDWAAGLRSLKYPEEYEEGIQKLSSERLRGGLGQARQLYLQGRLEEAYELDFFLPRIKQRYVQILKEIAKKQDVDLIEVQRGIPLLQSSEFFCDYCHPIEPANKLILEEFLKMMNKHKIKHSKQRWNVFSRSAPLDDIYPIF